MVGIAVAPTVAAIAAVAEALYSRCESWMHVAVNPAFTLPIVSGQWPKCGRDRRRPMAS
jgi:hypothetical protein